MASTLDEADVLRIAALAHLALTPAEVTLFTRQLADILAYADEIQQVDTTGVPATSHALANEAAWRDDEPSGSLDRTASLQNAPDAARAAGLFKVPKVL
jgi:aspartyl-tRNA(Asn)/glutamyl-tRNA(Gln) amidotransferase subunit C